MDNRYFFGVEIDGVELTDKVFTDCNKFMDFVDSLPIEELFRVSSICISFEVEHNRHDLHVDACNYKEFVYGWTQFLEMVEEHCKPTQWDLQEQEYLDRYYYHLY